MDILGNSLERWIDSQTFELTGPPFNPPPHPGLVSQDRVVYQDRVIYQDRIQKVVQEVEVPVDRIIYKDRIGARSSPTPKEKCHRRHAKWVWWDQDERPFPIPTPPPTACACTALRAPARTEGLA